LDAIPEGMGADAKKKLIFTGVDAIISTAVKAVWETGKALIRQGRAALESGIKSVLTPLFDAEKMVLQKISDACTSTIGPAMKTLMDGVGSKVVAAICEPIRSGYISAVKLWAEIAKVFTKAVTADNAALGAAETVANKAVWAGGNALKLATDTLLGAFTGLGDLLEAFDPSDLVSDVLDGIMNLMVKGIATLKATITTGSTPDAAYTQTLKLLVGDAKIMFADAVRGIIVKVVELPFDSLVRAPCLELVAPMDELIPEPVKAFMSITGVMEKLFETTIEASADAIANPLTSPEEASIDALEPELALV